MTLRGSQFNCREWDAKGECLRASEPGFSPAQIVPIGVSISVQVTVEWEVR